MYTASLRKSSLSASRTLSWAYISWCCYRYQEGRIRAHADVAECYWVKVCRAFCIPGSVADDRKVGLGHGNLAAMLLSEDTECFAFLAGHESFAAAEGAIGIAEMANKVRKEAAARYLERSW